MHDSISDKIPIMTIGIHFGARGGQQPNPLAKEFFASLIEYSPLVVNSASAGFSCGLIKPDSKLGHIQTL
jgi:hypothetical protein